MKVGIITHYYNSLNYGGNLQAYALVKIINKLGYDCEQISYDFFTKQINIIDPKTKKICSINTIKQFLIKKYNNFNKVYNNLKLGHYSKEVKARIDKIKKFNQQIPHTIKTYNINNIGECNKDYDAFITGSDQVWNLSWYNPAFFLHFVDDNKIKISYAASMAMPNLTKNQQVLINKYLIRFDGISVREEKTKELIESIVDKQVEVNLDPTLLLGKEEWDRISSKNLINEKYVFCYFLGEDKSQIKIAKNFAIKKGLKLCEIAYINGFNNIETKNVDIKMCSASIEDFISLIKHAEYVFTNSFHATVFSHIYQKQFFVLNNNSLNMSSRIDTLLKMFGTQDRFLSDEYIKNIDNVINMEDINYTYANEQIEIKKRESYDYLKNKLIVK